MKFFGFIAAIVLLSSCSDLKKPEQLKQISEMQQSLDSMFQLVVKENQDSLNVLLEEVNEVNHVIAYKLSGDTIQLELAQKLESFQLMRNNLSSFVIKVPVVDSLLKESMQSVTKLKQDIENDSGKRNKYDEYLTQEKKVLDTLTKKLDTLIQMKTEALETYRKLYDEIASIAIDTTQAHKKPQNH